MTVEAFRDSMSNGFYKVMAEVAPQYQGISPSDSVLDPYFAVAEDLIFRLEYTWEQGGNGMANITRPEYRGSLGKSVITGRPACTPPKNENLGDACRISDDGSNACTDGWQTHMYISIFLDLSGVIHWMKFMLTLKDWFRQVLENAFCMVPIL